MKEVNQYSKQETNKQESYPNRNMNRPGETKFNSRFVRPYKAKEADAVESTTAPISPQPKPKPSAKSDVVVPYPARLTRRDLEILEFALDMKFISREEVFEKFFSWTKFNQPAKSNLWALERLAQLESAGFLKAVKSFSENTRYYIATENAYVAVMQRVEAEKVPKSVHAIDQRCFLHDKMVLKSRLEFEKSHPKGRWISDRRLRAGMASMFGLPSAHIPDGIYELISGERVAFELENAPKGPKAYKEKILFFVKLMRDRKNDPQMFSRVRFRCVRPQVFQQITDLTKIYGEMFQVELWNPNFEVPNEPATEETPETEVEA